MHWCFLCSNYGIQYLTKKNCSPLAFSQHLLTPLFHLFTALGAVTGWAGLSHPGLNRTFRSPGGPGVSLAAGASLGLWGKAAQHYSAGWRAVKGRNLYREERALLWCPGAEAWYISCVYPVIYSAPESPQNSSWYGLPITWWYRCLGQPPICCLLFPSLNLPCSLTPLYTGSAALFCSLKNLEHFSWV